jgi:predicted Zn-dependent peptidase
MNKFTESKQLSVLPNGVSVATDFMPGASSVFAGLWLPIGSGFESGESNGLAHFYEHLVFKGTKNRASFQIAKEIEDLGGHLNAYTSRDAVCFYIHIAKEHLKTAVSVLADLAMEPRLAASDFEKEKNVILEEIIASEDNPEEICEDFFHKAHFKNCGLALPIAGSLESVKNLKLSQLRERQKLILEELPLLLSVAGGASHSELLRICKKLFAKKTGAGEQPRVAYSASGGTEVLRKAVQQATVLLGASCEGLTAKEIRAMQIFNHIFGDGFTSRLFQNIREKHGLAYSINSSFDNLIQKTTNRKNLSMFQISFASEPQNMERIADLIRKEMKNFLRDGFAKNELERAKQGMIGIYKLSADSPSNRQNRLARQALRLGHALSQSQSIAKIKGMQADYVEAVVKAFAENSKWTFAAVVPEKYKSPVPNPQSL